VHRMYATGHTLSQFTTTLRTDVPMNPFALVMHGLDDASRAQSPSFADIARPLAALLDGAVMVAHGPTMDVEFLTRAFAACDIDVPALLHPIDTITLARRAFRAPSYALHAVCEHLQLPPRRWHRAHEDVAALHDVWNALVPVFSPPNLRDLWEVRIGQKSRVFVRTAVDQTLRALAESGESARVFARPPGDAPTAIACTVVHYDSPHVHLRAPSGHVRVLRADRIVRIERSA